MEVLLTINTHIKNLQNNETKIYQCTINLILNVQRQIFINL